MSENLLILHKKLDHLGRMRGDVLHSIGKLPGPLNTIETLGVAALTPDEREILSAFTTRFATYQEQIGKAMRSIAIEEESATQPFGSILALMEKLDILDDLEMWRTVRELRNDVSHEYEDDAEELHQILSSMAASTPWLIATHEKLKTFVIENYPARSVPGGHKPF